MNEGGQQRLLVIDDDELFLEIAKVNLEGQGFVVETPPDPRHGVNLAIDSQFDLILLDLMMPVLNGEEVLSLLKPLGTRQRILVVSGHTGETYRSRARDLGAVGYLQKPVTASSLCNTVVELLQAGAEEGGDEVPDADWLVSLVFGEGPASLSKKLMSWAVFAIFAGVLAWLFWG